LGTAAGVVTAERRNDTDALVKRIVERFLAYRTSVSVYMVYADTGQMTAGALDYKS
jgi:hypothetical protein